jgi:hypothetical protein
VGCGARLPSVVLRRHRTRWGGRRPPLSWLLTSPANSFGFRARLGQSYWPGSSPGVHVAVWLSAAHAAWPCAGQAAVCGRERRPLSRRCPLLRLDLVRHRPTSLAQPVVALWRWSLLALRRIGWCAVVVRWRRLPATTVIKVSIERRASRNSALQPLRHSKLPGEISDAEAVGMEVSSSPRDSARLRIAPVKQID